jgi:hypothetical protein
MLTYVSNIKIPAGADYSSIFVYLDPISRSPVDFSGYSSIWAILKKSPQSLTTTAEFEVTVDNTEITLSLPSNVTSILRNGRYSYDILIRNGNITSRIFEGSAIVTGSVTTTPYPPVSIPELDIDGTDMKDKYVLMYDANSQTIKFINPDDVLNAAAETETTQPGLVGFATSFLNKLDIDLDNKIDIDGGQF